MDSHMIPSMEAAERALAEQEARRKVTLNVMLSQPHLGPLQQHRKELKMSVSPVAMAAHQAANQSRRRL